MLVKLIRHLCDWYRYRQTVHHLEMLDDHLLDDLGTERDQIDCFAWQSVRPAMPCAPERGASGLEAPRQGSRF